MVVNSLIYLSFIFLSFGQIGRLSLVDRPVNIYLYEITVILLIVFFFFKYKFKLAVVYLRKFNSIFIFFSALLLSWLLNMGNYHLSETFIGFLYFLRVMVYFLFFIYLQIYLKQNKNKIILLNGVDIFILITVVFSLIQYFLYPDLRNLFYLGWDPHLYRLFGLFFDTSISGAIFGLIFLYISFGRPQMNKYQRWAILLIYFIFIALTFSRSLYLAFFITLFLSLFRKTSFKFIIFYLLLFIFLLIIIPKPSGEGVNLRRIFSVESRKANYLQAVDLWRKSPIFGIGYNHIRYAKIKANIQQDNLAINHAGASFHSSFLIMLVSGGVIGLILFIYILYQLAITSRLSLILILFLSLLSLSDNIILHPFVLILFLTISSLSGM